VRDPPVIGAPGGTALTHLPSLFFSFLSVPCSVSKALGLALAVH
jgi:hypothetical protein